MNDSDTRPDEQKPFPTKDDHPASPSTVTPPQDRDQKKKTEEELLDEGLDETFPASDPVSIGSEKPKKKSS